MKHKIVTILSLAVVFAAGALSVVSYNHYRTWRDAQERQAIAANAAETRANLAQKIEFNNELAKLKAQCAKDEAAYAAMTPAQKAKAVAPTCNAQVVQ